MKTFIKQFFDLNKQEVIENDRGFRIILDDQMQQLFNQSELNLVFDVNDVDEKNELVTYGSFVLNSIYQYLQPKGEKIVSRLAKKHKLTKKDARKMIRVQNAALKDLTLRNIRHVDVVYNFKISYLSDEKSEELFSIGIDRFNNTFDPKTYYDLDSIYQDLTNLNQKTISLSTENLEDQFKICLKEVGAYAEERARNLQNEMLKRLYKDVTRIKGFYYGQIEEMNNTHPQYENKRVVFEREYQHKLKDEVNNHRLRVIMKLISYHLVERSDMEIDCSFAVPQHENISFLANFDCYTGELDYGPCPTCGNTMGEIIFDRNAKIGCENCIYVCTCCHKPSAELQGREFCHICAEPACADCISVCHDCGKPCCDHHVTACAIEHEHVCRACVQMCSVCQDPLCKDHTFVCAMTEKLICFRHRIACRSCRKVFSETAIKGDKCPACNNKM